MPTKKQSAEEITSTIIDAVDTEAGATNYYARFPLWGQPTRTIRETAQEALTKSKFGQMEIYTFKDVLNYAYTQGFHHFANSQLKIETTLDQQGKAISTATVTTEAVFLEPVPDWETGEMRMGFVHHSGIGDANYENTGNKVIGKHFIRMAETRAQGRALARALNLDANFQEEMGGDDTVTPAATTRSKGSRSSNSNYAEEDPEQFPNQNRSEGGWECEECGEVLKDTAQSSAGRKAQWAVSKTGRILCWDDQKAHLARNG